MTTFEIRPSRMQGLGAFATEAIPAGDDKAIAIEEPAVLPRLGLRHTVTTQGGHETPPPLPVGSGEGALAPAHPGRADRRIR